MLQFVPEIVESLIIALLKFISSEIQTQMLHWISKIINKTQPPFKMLQTNHLPSKFIKVLNNSVYWMPRVQQLTYTQQLDKYMGYLQRKKHVTHFDMKEMVQNMMAQFCYIYESNIKSNAIFEPILKSQTLQKQSEDVKDNVQSTLNKISVQKDMFIPRNLLCPYEGEVTWFVAINNLHFLPVMFMEQELKPVVGAGLAYSNMIMRNQIYKQLNSNLKTPSKNEQFYGYSLITNGQQWQLFRTNKNANLDKSIIFEARQTADNKFRNIYKDEEMISTCLGLLMYGLDIKTYPTLTLQKAYQYIDDKKYMIEGDTGYTPATKFLLKFFKKQ